MKLLDPNDPFFAQPWRRWATGVLPLLWGAVEFYLGSPGWGVVFMAAGIFALWVLIFNRPDNG